MPALEALLRVAADSLRHVSRHRRGKVIVVWDNGKPHKAREVKDFLRTHPRFEVVPLPPDCPELNPDKDVWSWTKTKALRNLCAWDADYLAKGVRRALKRMGRRRTCSSPAWKTPTSRGRLTHYSLLRQADGL